METSSLTE